MWWVCAGQTILDFRSEKGYHYFMVVTEEIGTKQLADLIKQVQAGNEVLLTQGNKPVAKLVSALRETAPPHAALRVRSFKGHRVLTPVISQAELADEIFSRQ